MLILLMRVGVLKTIKAPLGIRMHYAGYHSCILLYRALIVRGQMYCTPQDIIPNSIEKNRGESHFLFCKSYTIHIRIEKG